MTVSTYLSVGFLNRFITHRKSDNQHKERDFVECVGEAWHPDEGIRYNDNTYLHIYKRIFIYTFEKEILKDIDIGRVHSENKDIKKELLKSVIIDMCYGNRKYCKYYKFRTFCLFLAYCFWIYWIYYCNIHIDFWFSMLMLLSKWKGWWCNTLSLCPLSAPIGEMPTYSITRSPF